MNTNKTHIYKNEHKELDTTMTTAEKKINEHGFVLVKSDTINIDDKISYPFVQYCRFLDDDYTTCDMSITFDPSQYSVMLDSDASTVFVDPDLLDAIMERTRELKYSSSPAYRKNTSLADTVIYMERSTGKTVEINPNINDAFFDTFYANMFRSGAFILISGELPAKWQ